MKKPLEGIKVLDFTQALAGPFCAMYMADFGAEVIKVEKSPCGDQSRGWGPYRNGFSGYFALFNRNKKSIALDMASAEGKKIIMELVKECDVVLENFKVGTLDRLGLGYEAMKAVNPQIIYGSISGFGMEGPLKDYPCYDVTATARSGLLDRTGERGGPPLKPGFSLGDNWSGLNLLFGITMGLLRKQATGKGCRMDIAMLDAVFAMLEQPLLEYSQKGSVTPKNGNHDNDVAPLGLFKTKDGYVAIACSSEKQWATCCDLLEIAHLKADERFLDNDKRVQNLDALIPEIEKATITRGKIEIEKLLSSHRLACGAVKSISELILDDEQIKAREMAVEVIHPQLGPMHMMGMPMKFSKTPGDVTMRPAPVVGQDAPEILGSLGYTPEDVAAFENKGIICQDNSCSLWEEACLTCEEACLTCEPTA